MLPDDGRLYLQTMVFGRNMIDPDEASIDAPRDSDAWYLALMMHQFPGSFLPFGHEQIVEAAAPHFRLVSAVSGRLDYIETIKQWRARFAERSLRKTLMKARLRAEVPDQQGVPPRLHLRREREQRLLRARAARPLPTRLRARRSGAVSRAARTETLIAMVCAAIVQLPTAAIVVALPTIHTEFDASLAELQWTVTAFYIPFSALLIAAGRLADVFGRRRTLLLGAALFASARRSPPRPATCSC